MKQWVNAVDQDISIGREVKIGVEMAMRLDWQPCPIAAIVFKRCHAQSLQLRKGRQICCRIKQPVGAAALKATVLEVVHQRIDAGGGYIGVQAQVQSGVKQGVGVAPFARAKMEVVVQRV